MLDIEQIITQAKKDIHEAKSLNDLEQTRIKFFGKKGSFANVMKYMSQLTNEEKPKFGSIVNDAKNKINRIFSSQKEKIENDLLNDKLLKEEIDVTLDGRNLLDGGLHPITQTIHRILNTFQTAGFDIAEGPEIENQHYNFEALNIPNNHPARSMHDTFFFNADKLLRTHTSPVQIRAMEKGTLPLKILCPGKVYRCDSDMTHSPMFHQVEGLCVDEDINFANLKGLVSNFLKEFFTQDLNVRFRPSFFPFTEPSAEVDISCVFCNGVGCRTCKQTGWIEIMGCGMVHPNVFKSVNIDSEKYTGFAFGVGVERLAMLYYGINDLRLFYNNDIRFLKQFNI